MHAENIDGPCQHQHEANGHANGVSPSTNGLTSHANGTSGGSADEAVDTEAGKVAVTASQQIVKGLKAVAASVSGNSEQPRQSGIAAVGDC